MQREGPICSAILHVGVVLLAYFGLPQLMHPAIQPEIPIPVDVVTLSDRTSPPKSEIKPEPPKEQAQLPKAPPLPTPPQKPTPEKPQEQQVAQVPPTPSPEPQPKLKPLPEKKPEPEPKPKPIVQEAPRAKPKPPPQENLDTILKNVEKIKPKTQSDPADKVIKELAQAQPQPPSSLNNLATISLIDEARRQIERCWNVPAGAKDAKDLMVEIHVLFNPDGTVREATIVDQARENTDTFYRAAAESARRAVLLCQPLKLPPDKYSDWQEITFRFDPSQML
jgi:outer membrane biosynthesis protein TonB